MKSPRVVLPPAVAFSYNFMQDPLAGMARSGAAWDHAARPGQRRGHGRTSSSPSRLLRPKGRGYMPVLKGLAVPKTAPNAGANQLIRWMLGVGTQAKTLGSVGFFPVVGSRLSKQLGAAFEDEHRGGEDPAGRRRAQVAAARRSGGPRAKTSARSPRTRSCGSVSETRRRSSTNRASCRRSWTRPPLRAGHLTRRATGDCAR